ncbi:MAG: 50S ribosomal protein L10 [bacterium]
MPTQQKAETIQVIKEKLEKAQSVVLTDYRGLNVAQMTELRKRLREAGVEYKVLKNTLTKIAAKEVGISEEINSYLEGPVALAFTYDDPVSGAKVLNEFSKENDNLEIKAGILDNKVIDAAHVKDLAELPSKEVLLSQLLSAMQGPMRGLANVLQGTIRNLVYALDAVKNQKENQ